MQTFLPYPNSLMSAQVLDDKRLGKQRVEAIQIARCLLGVDGRTGWKNHPAVKMWRGHEPYLINMYLRAMIDEWQSRGFRNIKVLEHLEQLSDIVAGDSVSPPEWFTDDKLIMSHRSNLIRKKPDFYRQIWPDVPDNLEYVWPV